MIPICQEKEGKLVKEKRSLKQGKSFIELHLFNMLNQPLFLMFSSFFFPSLSFLAGRFSTYIAVSVCYKIKK